MGQVRSVTQTCISPHSYPWAPGKPSTVACYLTDAEWILDELKGSHDAYNLPDDKARYRVRSDGEVLHGLDLMVDFISAVHVPSSIVDLPQCSPPSGPVTLLHGRRRPVNSLLRGQFAYGCRWLLA